MNEMGTHRRRLYMQQCADLIDKHGWMVQGVFPTEASPGAFAYTVGLTVHGFPELAIAGLPPETMQSILNDLAGRVFDSNRRFTHGEVLVDVLGGGFKVTIVEGSYSRDDLWPGIAHALYGQESVKMQQVVWPDGQHRFPWDEEYSLSAFHQPTIGMP